MNPVSKILVGTAVTLSCLIIYNAKSSSPQNLSESKMPTKVTNVEPVETRQIEQIKNIVPQEKPIDKFSHLNRQLKKLESEIQKMGYPSSLTNNGLSPEDKKILVGLIIKKEKIKNKIHKLNMRKIRRQEI